MKSKLRLKILQKIAQSTIDLPTTQVAQTTSVSGAPTSFVASNLYPTIVSGFSSRNIGYINALADLLNTTIFYNSNGQLDLNRMKSNNFNVGLTSVPSADLKDLMGFSKALYNVVFTNHGQEFKKQLSPQEIAELINNLKNNQFLQNLPSTNPVGQLGTKVEGNIKTLIVNYLSNIK
jgi:hypothetical protein